MAAKKRCKYCKNYSYSAIRTPSGSFCDYDHAMLWATEKRIKDKEKVHKQRKRKFYDDDRSTRIKSAQAAFNAYIRERDANLPCVSCLRHHEGQYHAGHYRTCGAHPELRFEESNCAKQCSVCNNHLSGNIADYRIELVRRLGVEKVEWLEGPHEPKKYTCEELKEIELKYKQKLKDLKEKGL